MGLRKGVIHNTLNTSDAKIRVQEIVAFDFYNTYSLSYSYFKLRLEEMLQELEKTCALDPKIRFEFDEEDDVLTASMSSYRMETDEEFYRRKNAAAQKEEENKKKIFEMLNNLYEQNKSILEEFMKSKENEESI